MNWEKDKRFTNLYYCTKNFNGYKYVVAITVEERSKSMRFWVMASSGKKRNQLLIFEDKGVKSLGGIKALIWMKKAMLSFPDFYNKNHRIDDLKLFICIGWSDNRRRDIYERLEKEGFYFMQLDGDKVLMKEIKLDNERHK